MKNPEYEAFKTRLDEIETQIEEDTKFDWEELKESVRDLETEIKGEVNYLQSVSFYEMKGKENTRLEKELAFLKTLIKRINNIKKENETSDMNEDTIRDIMFPDRHDSDFYED